MDEAFRVLVADPPWSHKDGLPGYPKGLGKGPRGAKGHYATMAVERICRFPLPPMASDSVLLLWRVSSMQEEALAVCRCWGFTAKSEIVWIKKTKRGRRHFGMGHYVRAEHETCIIATRGAAGGLVKTRSMRSTFEAPAGRHSEKPEAFYDLVEALFEGPYAEIFARTARAGWTQWGKELPGRPAAPEPEAA